MRWVKRDKTFSGRFYSSDPPGYRKIVLLLLPFCWLAAFGGRNRGHKMCRVRTEGEDVPIEFEKGERGERKERKFFLTTAVGKEIVVSPPPLFLSLSPFLSQYLAAGVRSFRRRERNREKCILFSFPPPPLLHPRCAKGDVGGRDGTKFGNFHNCRPLRRRSNVGGSSVALTTASSPISREGNFKNRSCCP